jgi:hypothetical protein
LDNLIYGNIIKADIDKPLVRKNVGVAMASGDALANRYGASITRNGTEVDVETCSVIGYLIRPNDETLKLDGAASGNLVYVDIPKNGYVYDGAFSLALKIRGDGLEKTIAIFDGQIARTTTEHIVDGDRVVYGVEDILALVDDMEKAEADASSAAARANTAAGSAESAASSANTAARNAEQATTNANNATTNANSAAESINGMTVAAQTVEYGTGASAELSKVNGKYHITIKAERGPQGETGHGLDIKGTYGTIEALRAAVPNPSQGDMYNVGTRVPHSIYMWDDGLGDWIYQGELQGATGAHYTPVITETADAVTLGWNNDGGLENPPAVNIRGKDGYTPVKGTDYWTAADKNGIVQDVLAALPNASGVSF